MDEDDIRNDLKRQRGQILKIRKVKADQMRILAKECLELTERATTFENAIRKLEK